MRFRRDAAAAILAATLTSGGEAGAVTYAWTIEGTTEASAAVVGRLVFDPGTPYLPIDYRMLAVDIAIAGSTERFDGLMIDRYRNLILTAEPLPDGRRSIMPSTLRDEHFGMPGPVGTTIDFTGSWDLASTYNLLEAQTVPLGRITGTMTLSLVDDLDALDPVVATPLPGGIALMLGALGLLGARARRG